MKLKHTFLVVAALLANNVVRSQVFTPIASTGYTLDAIAENTTALATTAGALDGSNYILYSAAYGALMSSSYGLPNNGLISSGTRTYQLQSYTVGNVMYLMAGQVGSITLNTPAQFAGISLLGFGTEGSAAFDVAFTFTDNTTVTFTNQSYPDWFGTGNTILSGFDRATRTTGTPALTSGNPKLFNLDYSLDCASRSKALASISFTRSNTGTARLCVLAISGTGAPSYSATSTPVTCQGGNNGSATVINNGGLPPFTYTWSTSPVITTSVANNIPVGVYSYSVQDNGGCVVTGSIAVTQSLATQPNLTVSSSAYTVCSGNSFTLGVFGASTYSWVGGNNSTIYAPPVVTTSSQTTMSYSVSGTTSVNCLVSGTVSVTINPLPAAAFSSTIVPQCKTNAPFALAPFVSPGGGVFTGQGVTSGSFIPGNPGLGTFTITYTRTDANNCVNTATIAVSVSSLAVPSMSVAGPFCSNASAAQMSVSISGGNFGGTAISSSGNFSPSVAGAGSFPISYSITNGACTTTAGITILVNAAPTASIVNPKTFFCKDQKNTFLSGSPAGGAFSGSGIVTNGAFSPSAAIVGTSNIVVYTYTDVNGCSDTASVRITVSTCTGINEVKGSTLVFSIAPNPNKGSFVIESSESLQVELVDMIGQTIETIQIEAGKTTIERNLAAGIYYLRDTKGGTTQRFVITN